MTKERDETMSQVWGFGVAGLSVLVAAVVSGLRLKPYLDAGQTHTPLTFAFYPALVAVAVAVPVVLLLRWWQGKKDVDVGPVRFVGNLSFIAFGCVVYVVVATAFFPYKPPPEPRKTIQATDHRRTVPLSGSNFSVF